jgi:hypothetical protein
MRETCAAAGVPIAGENALPCFMPNAMDEVALQRIVYNTQVRLEECNKNQDKKKK